MAKPWSEVAASPQFQALSADQQDAARSQYFDQVVAPQLKPDQVDAARSQFDQQTAIKPQGGAGSEFMRQLGLTARDAINGATALPAMVGDALNAGVNLGIRGVNAAHDAMTSPSLSELVTGRKPLIPELKSVSGSVNDLENLAGLPQPQTGTERIINDVATAMAGAGGQSALAGKVADVLSNPRAISLLRDIAGNPAQQVAAAAGGAGSAGVAREGGASPAVQAAAGLAGGLAPSLATAGGAAATRFLLRGGDQNIPDVQDAIKTFRGAGTEPSVGQATGNRFAQATESLLSKYPGGAGVMAGKAESQAAEIGTKVEKLADNLSANATPSVAGRAIEKGLSGPGGFVDRFKQGQKVLYDKLDQFIKPSDSIKLSNTEKTLASMNQDIQGARNISQRFKNREVMDIEEALKRDTLGQNGTLPYQAVKKLRTQVGEKIENGSLSDSVPRSQWRALYAALSKDLDGAAQATGNPGAVKAMQRANAFSRAGHTRIDDILDKVSKQDIPEKVFKSAVNPADMQAGASKIQGIMKSLTDGERDVVKSAFVRRMGLASAGQQGAEGDTFSSQTFLTNWNKMSPQAKDVMFSSKDGNLRKSLDQIASTAERIKEGSKVFANPSGTAPAIALAGLAGSAGTALATGNIGTAAGLLGSAASANLTARLMTNPRFVSWLARATQIRNPETAVQAIQSLGKTMQGEPDDVQQDASDYAKGVLSAK